MKATTVSAISGLLTKDILSQKKTVIFAGVYGLVFFIFLYFIDVSLGKNYFLDANVSGMIYTLAPIVIAYMLTAGSFKSEKFHWDTDIASLPISKGDIVNAKFIGHFLFMIYGILSTALFGGILYIFPGAMVASIIPPIALIRILSGSLILSFIIPMFFRFGFEIFRNIMMIILFAGVALQVILMMMTVLFKQVGMNIIDSIIAFFTLLPIWPRNLIILGFGGVICIVSYILSLRIIRRKSY